MSEDYGVDIPTPQNTSLAASDKALAEKINTTRQRELDAQYHAGALHTLNLIASVLRYNIPHRFLRTLMQRYQEDLGVWMITGKPGSPPPAGFILASEMLHEAAEKQHIIPGTIEWIEAMMERKQPLYFRDEHFNGAVNTQQRFREINWFLIPVAPSAQDTVRIQLQQQGVPDEKNASPVLLLSARGSDVRHLFQMWPIDPARFVTIPECFVWEDLR